MRLDERGKQCPLPVIEAKKALEKAEPGSVVEVVVDNEIAVQNLKKLALHKGLDSLSEKVSEREFLVKIWAGVKEKAEQVRENAEQAKERAEQVRENAEQAEKESIKCALDCREKGLVLVLASDEMGQGDAVLGRLLMKGFVYAVTQQDKLPETVLLFNGGAKLSCQGSDSLEDLKELEAQGVEILTCGTCLNHYGIAEKLLVGNVTNMYEIVEKMTGAKKIVRP
ncbi:MAG: sulfurtransferase-like selenium metabolism protein YedF [Lachnospiraceae bacterium]|jgi:selenium metabolism protein YedF|nr:sulfurtransferase-like selenium metabolism protein YedF [Lachnospiraceae bacterium]